jgi:ubiquinone/menaquinone biosynthesis C-methylase UbiE
MTKDNFSIQSKEYSQFRPGYPEELINFILDHTKGRSEVWDCATGNGQVASMLSEHFEKVYATDLSETQLLSAVQKNNIIYSTGRAEETTFNDNQFDLITVGQAAHWFNFTLFYNEVLRILKPGGTLALFGYMLPSFNKDIDEVIHEFYEGVLGNYWDPERKMVDDAYTSIPFPFNKITNEGFNRSYDWNFEQTIGFFSTWSAVQHYKKANGTDPLELLAEPLRKAWGDVKMMKVTFPFFLVAGIKS